VASGALERCLHFRSWSHAHSSQNSSKSPSPPASPSGYRAADQGGHRDSKCHHSQYKARSRSDRTRPDVGSRWAGWLASRGRSDVLRRAGNHALFVTIAASLLPHGLKAVFDQTRPDRRTVVGHLHGVSFSGKRNDAFPSGHALHMGALASAAGTLPALPRRAIQTVAVGLSLTRILVLAHWASDVVAGFALGALLERLLRLRTGYPLERSKEDDHANS
jgi:hypothetical protein